MDTEVDVPPGFTARQRDRITSRLRETGMRLFTTQGLRKTSLDELVAPAGIAKSSFYAFFDSKEALYLDLMFRQAPELHERLIAGLDERADTSEAIRRFLHGALEIQRDNPLYRRLLTHPDELEAVSAKVSPEQLEEAQRSVVAPIVAFIENAQRDGDLVDADPDVVLGVLQAVLAVPVAAAQLDPRTFPAVLELLVDAVAVGLTRGGHTRTTRRRETRRA